MTDPLDEKVGSYSRGPWGVWLYEHNHLRNWFAGNALEKIEAACERFLREPNSFYDMSGLNIFRFVIDMEMALEEDDLPI